MPLFEHGFLGAEADQVRQQILHKYADLFASLKELNDVCHEYLRTAKYHHGEGVDVSAVSYFMRGLMTFQSKRHTIHTYSTAGLFNALSDHWKPRGPWAEAATEQ